VGKALGAKAPMTAEVRIGSRATGARIWPPAINFLIKNGPDPTPRPTRGPRARAGPLGAGAQKLRPAINFLI